MRMRYERKHEINFIELRNEIAMNEKKRVQRDKRAKNHSLLLPVSTVEFNVHAILAIYCIDFNTKPKRFIGGVRIPKTHLDCSTNDHTHSNTHTHVCVSQTKIGKFQREFLSFFWFFCYLSSLVMQFCRVCVCVCVGRGGDWKQASNAFTTESTCFQVSDFTFCLQMEHIDHIKSTHLYMIYWFPIAFNCSSQASHMYLRIGIGI